ncbi:cupin 2 domain-containing protein [Oscillochloris trichoides DG-6]|uniref:Cupin 2 domain-containing protein n=1 Tax=Oscillochloris trichoides DG-6 TaxID=765420 RepID=E1II44_9CHLR|nr:cupin domain-containing protein [Oscillochloris trichoides]EFO79162.1 cupin 2 domain-containing protein [Oscillochloris trichoides DG-6]
MPKIHSHAHSARDLHVPEARDCPSPQDGKVDVGARLRFLREGRQLSIRALAEASGLAVNTLSLIENGKTSPSVSTLQQVAVALGVPITSFFEPDSPRSRVVYMPASQRRSTNLPHGMLSDLGAGLAQRTIEPLLITLDPGAGSGSHAIVHPGQEFVFCLEGRIQYTVDGAIYVLEPGDSLIFESTLPHGWENLEASPARALLVLCP